MKPFFLLILVLALQLLLGPRSCPVQAQLVEDVSVSIGVRRAEGVTAGPTDSTVFIGDMVYGGFRKVDLITGKVTPVLNRRIPIFRSALGLHYDAESNLVFVAGGGNGFLPTVPSTVWAYNADSGDEIASCHFPAGNASRLLYNDLVELNRIIYITDSLNPFLSKWPIKDAVAGLCPSPVDQIALPKDLFDSSVRPEANGIVVYGEGLIVCRYTSGGLYYVNVETGTVNEFVTPEITGSGLDGLAYDEVNQLLYTITSERVLVYAIQGTDKNTITGNFVGVIISDLFATAATGAIQGDKLVVTNLGGLLVHSLSVVDRFRFNSTTNE